MSNVNVNSSTIVYAKVELSNGKFYIFISPYGSNSNGGLIDMLSGYSLTGPSIIHAFDEETGDIVGISTEAFVTITEVEYGDAEKKWLDKSKNTYIEA